MQAGKFARRAVVLTIAFFWAQAASAQGAANLDNATCLGCHGTRGFCRAARRRAIAPAVRCARSICRQCARQGVGALRRLPHDDHRAAAQDRGENRGRLGQDAHRHDQELHRLPCRRRRRVTPKPITARSSSWVSTHGATCADCHGSHDILRASNPASSVAPANLLNTCRKCHQDATPGFATFQPHATTDDFARYPYTWIASKFVNLAVGGVLLFFWAHSALWFYREYRDRQQQKPRAAYPRRSRAAGSRPLCRAMERDVALGALGVRRQHHSLGDDRHHLALPEHSLGAGARTRDGRTGNRRHDPSPFRRGDGRGVCLAYSLCRHSHRAELVERSKSSAPIR